METLAIANSAQPAAPAASAEFATRRDLRRELADCIADQDAADKAARAAKTIADRANRAKDEAAAAERLRQGLRVAADATAAHARACIEAMRAGKGILACPTTLPTVDSAPYAAAMAHLAALDRAAAELAADHNRAADAARAAAARVAALDGKGAWRNNVFCGAPLARQRRWSLILCFPF
jgi:hypothetical protein